uniref:Pleiotropic regulator 1 n=1 Tax=Panagrellus redivivus TaxID=6233 RepID=A0A7E4ZVI1_PANRE
MAQDSDRLTTAVVPGAAEMFLYDTNADLPDDLELTSTYTSLMTKHYYGHVLKEEIAAKRAKVDEVLALPKSVRISDGVGTYTRDGDSNGTLAITAGGDASNGGSNGALVAVPSSSGRAEDNTVKSLLPSRERMIKPKWHAPWKLYRVLSGHQGWVRAVDVEPENQWFATGGADRLIKIWDLASGSLKLSLTGHISAVRAVKISTRHPYLFSGGEDKQVKCWDLEYNKVVRHYHGHLSAVQALDLHPTLDVLVTSARDSTARVWDMRTKAQIYCLTGHTNTVASVVCQEVNPQIITGSHDSTVRLWDLASGKSVCTLTHHKKSVRALAIHPTLHMFGSASPDSIRQWRCPNGDLSGQLMGHNTVINALAINEDGVTVSGGDNGTMHFYDWNSRFNFQKLHPPAQPGSIDSERGIFALTFDKSGTRLISADADKSIKMFKEDPDATEETHPVLWRPELLSKHRH